MTMNCLFASLLLLYNWPGTIAGPPCVKVSPPNGKVVLKFRGRIAKFSCNPGFVLDGDKVATCIEGSWDAVPRCVHKIQCKQVKDISNGSVMLIRQRTVVKFTCFAGYKLIGSAATVSCSDYSPEKSKAECIPDVKLSCDFEDGLCGWENDLVTGFRWLLRSNATPSHALKTGPSGDHTKKDGYYLYIETSGMPSDESQEKVARLYSPLFPPADDSNVCFSFWYHMYGYSIGTLNVYLNNLLEFTQSGDMGNVWRKGVVKNLPTNRRFQIVIEATSGNGYAGDIAIDDIAIINSTDCVQKTLIETTCEGRCFETETNSSLCQCSSDCIVEASCCSDFMNFCSYESSTHREAIVIDDESTTRQSEATPVLAMTTNLSIESNKLAMTTREFARTSSIREFTFDGTVTESGTVTEGTSELSPSDVSEPENTSTSSDGLSSSTTEFISTDFESSSVELAENSSSTPNVDVTSEISFRQTPKTPGFPSQTPTYSASPSTPTKPAIWESPPPSTTLPSSTLSSTRSTSISILKTPPPAINSTAAFSKPPSRTHLLTSTPTSTVRPTQWVHFVPKSQANWTSVYIPKGHYTYSAAIKLESGPRTYTYIGIILSLLIIFTAIAFLSVKVIRRRRLRVDDGTEEGDVLFLSSDEALDFSIARRPLCESSQQN